MDLPRSGACIATVLAALLVCAIAFGAAAHEIPTDVKINAFFKPAGEPAYLLMRVPLAAMIEVDYPTRGPGYLDLARADEALRGATSSISSTTSRSMKTTRRCRRRVSPIFGCRSPRTNRSPATNGALRTCRARRSPAELELYWNQQLLDVLLEYPIASDRSEFAIQLRVDRFAQTVSTALRFLPPDGATRAFEFHGDPGLVRSIRAGSRPHCASSSRASGTSSKASITCCSCSAWCFRSGGCGRS